MLDPTPLWVIIGLEDGRSGIDPVMVDVEISHVIRGHVTDRAN